MISRDGDRLQVSGRLTIETVSALVDADFSSQGGAGLVIDLASVEAVDSSALSLLLSWLRRAQRGGATLSFANVPENLMSLANLYGVAEMLPLCGEAPAVSS